MGVAASEFYRDGKHDLNFKSPDDPECYITPDELADSLQELLQGLPRCLVLVYLSSISKVFNVVSGWINFVFYHKFSESVYTTMELGKVKYDIIYIILNIMVGK